MLKRHSREPLRAALRHAIGIGLVATVWVSAVPPSNAASSQLDTNPTIQEVGQLPVLASGSTSISASAAERSGWLIIDTRARRAYQIFEELAVGTIVQSFNLDTLEPRKRLKLNGFPVPTGRLDGHIGPGQTQRSSDVVHAVDEDAGILYLAMSDSTSNFAPQFAAQNSGSADARRAISRYVAIDERALDEGREAVSSFREPAEHQRLHYYWLHGMEVDRHHLKSGEKFGKLVLLFAQPQQASAPAHQHEMVQWDVADTVTPFAGAADSLGLSDPIADAVWSRVLDPCRTNTLTPAFGFPSGGGGFQWEMLLGPDSIVFGCQSAPSSGAAVRLRIEADGRPPVAGGMTVFPLSKPVTDVLVDRKGRRLFFRSFGGGETFWVFDANVERFTGSLAAKLSDSPAMSIGVDQGTGRLYTFLPDYSVADPNLKIQVPVRGGLQFADTRVTPPVQFDTVRPDVAYPAFFRTAVDPVTRRLFVRRGSAIETKCMRYPGTEASVQCPIEDIYRVYKDTGPVPEAPPEGDDAAFTTNVPEEEGVTKASYLGTGSGYGVRTVFVGGFGAATGGAANGSTCGRDDRELLSGSVGSVAVSDLSTAAVAAALDADIGTQKILAAPMRSCFSASWPAVADPKEFSFDERRNADPSRATPDGVNDYEASCVGEGTSKPSTVDRTVPREGFRAKVTCSQPLSKADGVSTGEFTLPAALRLSEPTSTDVRVAYAHSEVSVTRKLGQGVVSKVDSIARGIVIPGVGEIGAVRGEATATASGRPGSAKGNFKRTICGIDFGNFDNVGCLDLDNDGVVRRLNEAIVGLGEFRLRQPDPKLYAGSKSGYQAGVQRDRLDRFGDQIIVRDVSLAIPALELVLYVGDGGDRGTGRQIVQFAGVEGVTSYGIACLYGEAPNGKCATSSTGFGLTDDVTVAPTGDSEVVTVIEAAPSTPSAARPAGNRIVRLIKRIPELLVDTLRLLFSSPREFGLVAAVWALLYAPCYLGERRRSIRGLRNRRAALGGSA